MTNKKRILIGMSGGIDSTVAAILLLEQGYELVGATFRTFDPCHNADNKGCGSEDSVMAAQELAQRLGIEHHILDFRETFRKHVITNFVEEYARGRTPNPCVICNSHIKWGELIKAAEQYGCDYIATGHYAQIVEENGIFYVKKATNPAKDQSYMLFNMTQDQLAHTVLPLAELTKAEIRSKADEAGLAVAHKSDSQDICFVPDGDYASFIEKQLGQKYPEGNYIDKYGIILGKHKLN